VIAAEAVRSAETTLGTILKALVVGATVDDPASRGGGDENATAFTMAGALEPPYDPEILCTIFEHSNSLRQNVDSYATNIDGFGYRFEPAIELDTEDAQQKVTDTMMLELAAAREAGTLPAGAPMTRTAEQAATHLEELRRLASTQKDKPPPRHREACHAQAPRALRN
jgi:hypothetical protein